MKLTLFKRMTIGYAVVIVLFIFLGIYVTFMLNKLYRLTHDLASVDGQTIEIIQQLSDHIFTQIGFEKKFLISRDLDFYKQFWITSDQFIQDLKQLEAVMKPTGDDHFVTRINDSYTVYLALVKDQIVFMGKNKAYATWSSRNKKEGLMDEINRELRTVLKKARSERDLKIALSSQMSGQVLNVTTVVVGIAILVGTAVSFFITRSINRSIILLQEKTREIAKCNFGKISDISSPPEIKELADDFNTMCQRLKELEDMKEDFYSTVSHELRTPLTAIKEASSMLLDGSYADAPEKQRELLTITKTECERLINSVNRILDFSKMEANLMDFTFKKQNPVPLIRQTILKLAPIAAKKQIDLELKPPANLPAIWLDAERIAQVVENILGNALKFTDTGGKVTIQTLFNNDKNKYIEVRVSDNGRGIPKENMESIFEKFKRVENNAGRTQGTGLGLPIARYIVLSHGGKIWAKSELGKGSTFVFTLPAV
jgi:two-component system sensor histidine kinase GlrK